MLEYCVVVFHLVKCCEKMRVCLDQKANRVEERVRDPILIVFYLHHLGFRVDSIVHVEAVENVVLGNMGSCVLVKAPILWVTVPIILEGTQSAEGLLA